MESRVDDRLRGMTRLALVLAGGAVMSLAACHSNAKTATPAAPPPVTRAFGDTATYGVKVLSLDPAREAATFSLRAPAEVIVLAVVPGREIELILPAEMPRGMFPKGSSKLDMRRFDYNTRPLDANIDAQQMAAYNRCLVQAQATARRMAQARRPVRRDSTGKEIDDGRATGSDMDDLARLEGQCRRLDSHNAGNQKAPPLRMPPRAPADRYLVVLASTIPLSYAQVGERLSTLTAVGSDVATTIEAIAAGLYAGLPSTWSGGYVAW